MSNSDPFDALHPGGMDFDVTMFESPTQRILGEAFDETEATNRAALAEFDPQDPRAHVDIELTTNFPEAEMAEPEITFSKQRAMLQRLGLEFQPLESGHKRRIFEYEYKGGEVRQIRLVKREDGVEIPVYTAIGSDEAGNPLERITLLSHSRAQALAQRYEENLEEQRLDKRLTQEFGLEEEVLELSGYSLAQKRSLLASFEAIGELDTLKPDLSALKRVRDKLAKAMLPGSKIMSALLSNDKLAKAKDEYEKAVAGIAKQHGLDTKSSKDLIQSEQLLRLQALNEQLRKRKRSAKIGHAALMGLFTLAGTGIGSAGGLMAPTILPGAEYGDDTPKSVITGALVGAALGLGAGIIKGLELRKRMRDLKQFSAENFEGLESLDEQLRQERILVDSYIADLHR